MASAATTSRRASCPGANSATVSASPAASRGSISTATTLRASPEQAQGQRAQARADLEDAVIAAQVSRGDDPTHRVGVDDEVLPALLGRPDVVALGQQTNVRRAEKSRTGGRWFVAHMVDQSRPSEAAQRGHAP